MPCGESQSGGMSRRMEILSCSLLVCRALSAQWRSVGAVAPERVVASFVLALCRARAHFCWMFIVTHATALMAVSFKIVISTAPSSTERNSVQQNKILRVIKKNLVKKCLEMLAEICRTEGRLQSSVNSWASDSNLGVMRISEFFEWTCGKNTLDVCMDIHRTMQVSGLS